MHFHYDMMRNKQTQSLVHLSICLRNVCHLPLPSIKLEEAARVSERATSPAHASPSIKERMRITTVNSAARMGWRAIALRMRTAYIAAWNQQAWRSVWAGSDDFVERLEDRRPAGNDGIACDCIIPIAVALAC